MLARRTPLRRKAIKRKRVVSGPTEATVILVVRRSMRDRKATCEVCGDSVNGTRGVDWAVHHRRGRDGRPDSHTPQNLLLVCGGSNVDRCHGIIHADHGSEAEIAGWLISRNAIPTRDPLAVPVLIDRGSRWTYLTADGGYADDPPGEVA